MNLVIAEKPSVAQSIAKVLGATRRFDGYLEGNDYIVSWCVGHLVQLANPEDYDIRYKKWSKNTLPIFPEGKEGSWKHVINPTTKKQFNVLKSLMKRREITQITNACDAGREGELIFRLVYDMCECKKPIKRLWISSMEDEAIKEGFNNLKNGSDYVHLYAAALCRERADWLVGINGTRLFTTVYGEKYNVGRVMTPTLALVVEREEEIKRFSPEAFFNVKLECDGVTLTSKRCKTQDEAAKIADAVRRSGTVIIKSVTSKEVKKKAPQLFDLTSLQREANKKYGYTAQETLDYTQGLYEKKLASYPRTDSRFLTDDMAGSTANLIDVVGAVWGVSPTNVIDIEGTCNSKKVSDHHAIIPTVQIENVDIMALPEGERKILILLSQRLLEAVSSPYIYSETVISAECEGNLFEAKGRVELASGWKSVNPNADNDDDSDEDESILTEFYEGDEVEITSIGLKKGQTTAPKSYTEDTLLSAMERAGADEIPDEAERKGLGTPATRAAIIEKLVKVGFLERTGNKKTKYLIPTAKGRSIIALVPEYMKSASMTAEWEQKLLDIEKGKYPADEFMAGIEDFVIKLVAETVRK